jgi:hypothetical protein
MRNKKENLMDNAILTMGKSSRLVEPLTKGLIDQKLFFSYGLTIPDLTTYKTSYWMGGAFALKLQRIGLATKLMSPGVNWLPELPLELTGRKILEGNLDSYLEYNNKAWVKPSEAKILSMPAGIYTPHKIKEIFAKQNFTYNISLQWTETVMRMNYEHRFFVAEKNIITGSPYLINGKGYNSEISYSRYNEAKNFAEHVLKTVDTPPAFTLDVAFDENTSKWVVIEANRAWSSGLYGADPVAVLEVIQLSCFGNENKWSWQPDEHILQLGKEEPSLKIVPLEEIDNQPDVFEFSKLN